MRLLLLLSAMLSALSGAGVGARAPQAAVVVNSVATAAAEARADNAVIAGRPASLQLSRGAAAAAPLATGWSIAPTAPLYLGRRRE